MPFFPVPVMEALHAVTLAAAMECAALPQPRITVDTVYKPAAIDRSMSKEQLRAMQTDTRLPRQMRDLSHVETGGIMSADIHIDYDIDFHREGRVMRGHCAHVRGIGVVMRLEPKIHIANDYPEGSCLYNEIFQHEQSHIDMDRTVMEKYAQRIRDGLSMAFSEPKDAAAGPVSRRRLKEMETQFGANIMKMVDVILRDMGRERMEKQAAVDSLGGYAYIMNTCNKGAPVVRVKE